MIEFSFGSERNGQRDEALSSCSNDFRSNTSKEVFYSQSEVIEKFNISQSTLWRWNKSGYLKVRRFGRKNYYSESDILAIFMAVLRVVQKWNVRVLHFD